MSGYWCSYAAAVKPSLHGPGYDCEPAFGLKYDNDSPARVIDFADIEVAKSEELRYENVLYECYSFLAGHFLVWTHSCYATKPPVDLAFTRLRSKLSTLKF